MAVDSGTLYKLMILFMLNKVNFPLTYNQLSQFFLGKEYTSSFVLMEALTELSDSGFVSCDVIRNATYYHLMPEGEETLSYFKNQIPPGVIDDINTFIEENNYELRSEVSSISDYYKQSGADYVVHCIVKEGKDNLIELNVAVPFQEDAAKMCANWKDASQDIYEYVLKKLSK